MARFARATAPAAPPDAASGGQSGNSSSFPQSWRFRCANFYVLLIVFAVPLFSVPCSKGSCTAPVEVVASYLFTQGLVGEGLAKVALYPGAVLKKAESIFDDVGGFSFPDWDTLLQDFEVKKKPVVNDDRSLWKGLFVLGCLLCITGAILSMFGPSLISTVGMAIVLWYVYEEGKTKQDMYLLPMFALAILCSFAAVDLEWLPSKLSSMFGGSAEVNSQPENKKNS